MSGGSQFSEFSSLLGAFAADFMSAVFLRSTSAFPVLQVVRYLRYRRLKFDVFMPYVAYENPDLHYV